MQHKLIRYECQQFQIIRIYNTKFKKLKELQDDNQIKPVFNTYYVLEQSDKEISKEIALGFGKKVLTK